MSRHVLMAGVVAILAASPFAAAAGWGGKGDFEPSTTLDKVGGWMFPSPEQSSDLSVRQVYFDGYFSQCAETCTFVSPNVATVRSSVQGSDVNYQALFGVWKDCNKDGYIGWGDQGLMEYRAELLALPTVQSACPVESTPTPIPADWFPSHNDGTWVREFLPIAWRNVQPGCTQYGGQPDCNPYNVNDNGARAWRDFGVPGARYAAGCPEVPVARGTLQSTGGVIKLADCLDGWHVTDTIDNTVAPANPALNQLSFADAPRDQEKSRSTLNQQNPWGRENDASFVQAWDCSKPQLRQTSLGKNPASGGNWYLNVSQPKVPPGVATTGSVAGTLNATGSGLDQCSRNAFNNGNYPQGLVFADSGDHVHWGGALATAPYWLEYDVAGEPNKVEADDNLHPDANEQLRPASPYSTVLGDGTPPGVAGDELRWGDGVWSGGTQWTGTFMVNRAALGLGSVSYHTYYAYVSPTAVSKYSLTLPKGTATAKYGSETCGTSSSGISANNWNCDRNAWYQDTLGHDLSPRSVFLGKDPSRGDLPCTSSNVKGCYSYGASVGDPYNLRDVDCYDQSVYQARAAGASWGTVAPGGACADNN